LRSANAEVNKLNFVTQHMSLLQDYKLSTKWQRDLRYNWFYELLDSQIDYILTGHHALMII
jgi:tRNA(Ile)-lysidine synthase TilS/MesJ